MPTSDALIEAESLSVERGQRRVLHGLDFRVAGGQVTGLLGPSGCGKTTLMRTIVGVQARVSGRIDVLGQPAGSPSLRNRIGYVTQAPSVYADLTVTENLRFFARIVGVGRAEVNAMIETVDLAEFAHQVVGNLSGGQRSRVSLAVALLGEPQLLVLDEPTVGLDPVLRRGLWETFHRIASEGAGVIVSSHVMDEAGRCDTLLLMREGRFLAEGTPAEIIRSAGASNIEGAFLQLVGEKP